MLLPSPTRTAQLKPLVPSSPSGDKTCQNIFMVALLACDSIRNPERDPKVVGLGLFPADNGTAIHLFRHDESDFGIGSGGSILDLSVREELRRRKARIENDEDLEPQGIKSITLNRVEHRNEILFLVQIIRSKDNVDA